MKGLFTGLLVFSGAILSHADIAQYPHAPDKINHIYPYATASKNALCLVHPKTVEALTGQRITDLADAIELDLIGRTVNCKVIYDLSLLRALKLSLSKAASTYYAELGMDVAAKPCESQFVLFPSGALEALMDRVNAEGKKTVVALDLQNVTSITQSGWTAFPTLGFVRTLPSDMSLSAVILGVIESGTEDHLVDLKSLQRHHCMDLGGGPGCTLF